MTQIAAIDRPLHGDQAGAPRVLERHLLPTSEFVDWIASILAERTGLTFPPARRPVLDRGVTGWLAELEPRARQILAARIAPSDALLEGLISRVTVGETYFLRHEEQLELVRRHFLAPLVERRRREGNLSMRLWSAGCATGEEAYSLGMMLLDVLPDATHWDLRVLGTDIDLDALDHARTGRYGPWAFRVAGDYRQRWFTGGQREELVDDRLRQLVRFEQHNLADRAAPPPAGLGGPPDLILCRNVLIYMEPSTGREVRGRLYQALAPGGWLVFGPVDSLPSDDRLGYRQVDGFVFYERVRTIPADVDATRSGGARTGHSPGRLSAPRGVDSRRPVPRRGARDHHGTAARSSIAAPSAHGVDDLAEAVRLADVGRLDDADTACRRAIHSEPLSIPAHALAATIAEARGDLAAASRAWRQVLYLRHDHPVAAFRLGLVEWRSGRTEAARRRLRQAISALEPLADDLVLDGRDGFTVASVRSTIGILLG